MTLMVTPREIQLVAKKSRIRKIIPDKKLESDPVGTRTQDLRIKSPLLYQLSYRVKRRPLPQGDGVVLRDDCPEQGNS